jgi:DNA-binding ferritin-like protein
MIELDLERCCEEVAGLFNHDKYTPLAIFLACTEALQIVHHSHHWQTNGPEAYSDHLLFQRLYEQLQTEIDLVGEKLVGVSAKPALTNYFARIKVWQKFFDMVSTGKPYHEVSLEAEQAYLKITHFVMAKLSEADCLTSGLENMLAAIADKHEEHVYLLRQRATP